MCCGCEGQIHMDYRSPVEKKGWHGLSLNEREGPDPCLDRLLLLFWVHYSEDDPHLLCTGSPQVITFYRYKGKNVANYFKEKDVVDQG